MSTEPNATKGGSTGDSGMGPRHKSVPSGDEFNEEFEQTFEFHRVHDELRITITRSSRMGRPRAGMSNCDAFKHRGKNFALRAGFTSVCRAYANHAIGIMVGVAVPLLIQLVISNLLGVTIRKESLAAECYLLALGLCLALYAELRIDGDKQYFIRSMQLYHDFLHWAAPLGALAALTAVFTICIAPNSAIGQALSSSYHAVVLGAVALYLTYKLPTRSIRSGVSEQPMDDETEEQRSAQE